MHQAPRPVLMPLPKVVIDDAPWGQVVGSHAPGTPAAQQVENGMENLALRIRLGAATWFGCWHQMFDQVPFFIAEVGRIRLSGVSYPRG